LTRKIEKAAESLELYFLDHIVVTHYEIFSFRREKLLGNNTPPSTAG
jgi:DNA repair protein RadC